MGCEPQDTRDSEGKERFLVLSLTQNMHDDFPEWYRTRDVHGSLKVRVPRVAQDQRCEWVTEGKGSLSSTGAETYMGH